LSQSGDRYIPASGNADEIANIKCHFVVVAGIFEPDGPAIPAYLLSPFTAWCFPLARWRLWLWETVKQQLGFVLDLPVLIYV
jgi:hypothetical protein